jgi:glycosyltransferase involved in cell wall biosynthesis
VRIKRWGCDIIYTNTSTVVVGAVAAKILRKPHVWHVREFNSPDHGLSFLFGQEFSPRLISRSTSLCIANSRAVAEKYAPYIPSPQLTVIYNSMHLAHAGVGTAARSIPLPTPKRHFRCVTIGRLEKRKRQEDAIEAVAQLAADGFAVELLIVGDGDGSYSQSLQSTVEKHRLQDMVKFMGQVDNPQSLIQSADAILVCSSEEAFGRVTVEGMLAGKPVIGAKTGGTAELIEQGFNGLLFEVANASQLAQKIRFLYENPAEARRLGENSKRWAEKTFTKRRYSKELLAVLASLGKASTPACLPEQGDRNAAVAANQQA